jgi:hypothetical protein
MELDGSCLIRAIVGVIGSVFVDVVVEHKFRFSAFDFELFECVDGDEGGSVAAVQVSVTGQSSDLILIVATPDDDDADPDDVDDGSLFKNAAVNLLVAFDVAADVEGLLLFQD